MLATYLRSDRGGQGDRGWDQGGGGELPYKSDGDVRRKIQIKFNVGVAQA